MSNPDTRAVGGPLDTTVRPLLERLREAGDDYTVAWGSGALYDEAADEIERLHAESIANYVRAREWAFRAGEFEGSRDVLKVELAMMNQTCGDLCDACGWRFVVPDRGCLNCGPNVRAEPPP